MISTVAWGLIFFVVFCFVLFFGVFFLLPPVTSIETVTVVVKK